MNEENLLKQLYFINDWWASGRVPESKLEQFKRRDFHFLKEALNKQEISAVVGPRQVGKTTLLYQVIDHLLTVQKISPTQIFFLNMDNQVIKLNSDNFLEDALQIYSKNVLKKPLKEDDKRLYFFFDEIFLNKHPERRPRITGRENKSPIDFALQIPGSPALSLCRQRR